MVTWSRVLVWVFAPADSRVAFLFSLRFRPLLYGAASRLNFGGIPRFSIKSSSHTGAKAQFLLIA
jgi:hypothetical protein